MSCRNQLRTIVSELSTQPPSSRTYCNLELVWGKRSQPLKAPSRPNRQHHMHLLNHLIINVLLLSSLYWLSYSFSFGSPSSYLPADEPLTTSGSSPNLPVGFPSHTCSRHSPASPYHAVSDADPSSPKNSQIRIISKKMPNHLG